MPEELKGYYKVEKLRWWQTIWWALGFDRAPSPRFDRPDLDEGQEEGFAPGWFCLDIRIVLDWKDWLRLLLSRKLSIATDCKTDRIIGRSLALTRVAVLPPDAPVKRG